MKNSSEGYDRLCLGDITMKRGSARPGRACKLIACVISVYFLFLFLLHVLVPGLHLLLDWKSWGRPAMLRVSPMKLSKPLAFRVSLSINALPTRRILQHRPSSNFCNGTALKHSAKINVNHELQSAMQVSIRRGTNSIPSEAEEPEIWARSAKTETAIKKW